MRSLPEQRVERAFGRVRRLSQGVFSDATYSVFLARARELPTMLRVNGFAATWAKLCKDNDAATTALMWLLAHHLHARGLAASPAPAEPNTEFGRAMYRHWFGTGAGQPGAGQLDAIALRDVTAESIEYAGMVKRAAETFAPGDKAPSEQPAA